MPKLGKLMRRIFLTYELSVYLYCTPCNIASCQIALKFEMFVFSKTFLKNKLAKINF